jgi:hypothetical protein
VRKIDFSQRATKNQSKANDKTNEQDAVSCEYSERKTKPPKTKRMFKNHNKLKQPKFSGMGKVAAK